MAMTAQSRTRQTTLRSRRPSPRTPTASTPPTSRASSRPRRWTRRSTRSSPIPPTPRCRPAKEAWLAARDDYGLTEAFRFYGGPIDNEENGPEGLINAWPMDEAYVDYVDGDPTPGSSTTRPATRPSTRSCSSRSTRAAARRTSRPAGTPIEFLLWGQDLSEDGPGDASGGRLRRRRRTPTAARTYLATASDLLLGHLAVARRRVGSRHATATTAPSSSPSIPTRR